MLNDINHNKVFDDILVEYDHLLEGGFKSLGYSIDQLINNMVLPSFEDAETEIANYVTEGVDIEDIKEAIAESIRTSFYEAKKSSSTSQAKKQIQTIDDELSED